MLRKRMEEISKLVNGYNEKHFSSQDDIDNAVSIENFDSDDVEVLSAVREMGITLEEYKEWEEQWKESFEQFKREEDLAQRFDLTEEELRDENSHW